MTLSLYSTYRAWRRDIRAERAVTAAHERDGSTVYDAIAQLGVGLAGIACGGDTPSSGRRYRNFHHRRRSGLARD